MTTDFDRRRAQLRRRVLWAVTAAIAACVTLAAFFIVSQHDDAHQRAAAASRYSADVAAHEIELQLDTLAVAMRTVAARIERAGGIDADLQPLLDIAVRGIAPVRTVVVARPDGIIVADSRAHRPALGTEIATRDYFRVQVEGQTGEQSGGQPGDQPDGHADGLWLAANVRSRVDGHWLLPVSLAARDVDGGLLAVLAAAVDPEALAELPSLTRNAPDINLHVFERHGALLTLTPFDDARIGQVPGWFDEAFGRLAADPGEPVALDQPGLRDATLAKVADWPIMVLASPDTPRVEAAWHVQAALAGLGALCLAVLALGFARHEYRRGMLVIDRTEQVHETSRRLRDFAESASDWFFEADSEGKLVSHTGSAAVAPLLQQALDQIARAQGETEGETPRRSFRDREVRVTDAAGTRRWLRLHGRPRRDEAGDFLGLRGSGHDVTAMHDIEEKLFQSQKMEAVGKLVGGVAHDFNNLLTVIGGNLEMLTDRLRDDEDRRSVREALASAGKGASLIRMLLSISRRQPLEPVPTDAGWLVENMRNLLRRTLGERISVAADADAGLWPVLVDPVQLESALLNLAVNARDAMPDGGRLAIRLRNCRPGARKIGGVWDRDHVAISVSDTGVGMAEEVRARAVEQFFTTKAQAGGTGLGLAMVYGFVRRSGGEMTVRSQQGQGTTFEMLFQRHEGAGPALETGPAAATGDAVPASLAGAGLAPGWGEPSEPAPPPDPTDAAPETPPGTPPAAVPGVRWVVAVVEDAPELRDLLVRMLDRLGHRGIGFADGDEAMGYLRSGGACDVLLSDVVLPRGMDGSQVAVAARRLRPELAVLFMSGYAGTGEPGAAALRPQAPMLRKPFRRSELKAQLGAAVAAVRPAACTADAAGKAGTGD